MREEISQSLEMIEKDILGLQDNAGTGIGTVMASVGMSGAHLPAQAVALLDMLTDGITPVNDEITTALLGMVEAQKKFLLALTGQLDLGAAVLEQKPKKEEPAPEEESEEALCPVEKQETAEEAPKEEAKAAPAASKPDKLQQPQSITSIRVGTDRLDRVIELVGKLMVTYAVIAQGGGQGSSNMMSSLRELDNVITKLQIEVDAIRMVPLKQIFMPMHRLAKSLSQKIGKNVKLTITGDELPLDKTIVESLNEPLVHLIRNAVDHGLEDPEGREAAGKSEQGDLRLSAWRKGEYAYIQVKDDGRGLDPEKIRAKAIERDLLGADEEVDDKEILQFVLKSGFSTAEKVTDVSGRGVGMDAVVSAIRNSLDGDIKIESKVGKGASFTISIPLDRSANEGIVDAIICKVGGDTFIMPSQDVVEIYMPQRNGVVELPDGRETVDVRGEVHSLLRLATFLELEAQVDDIEMAQAIVVRVGEYRAAILVDEVLRQQQVVITRFTVPLDEVYDLPILGYGMMGESDAMVIDTEQLLATFHETVDSESDD